MLERLSSFLPSFLSYFFFSFCTRESPAEAAVLLSCALPSCWDLVGKRREGKWGRLVADSALLADTVTPWVKNALRVLGALPV